MPKPIYCRHSTEIDIPFFDVDAMQIVWHGHYVKYLEIARCAFLEAIGYDYNTMREHGYAWPVVQMNLKYIKPARFTQKIRVHLALTEYETCLRIDYTIVDAESGDKLTQASTTQVAVDIASGEMQFQTPDSWREHLARHPAFTPHPDEKFSQS